jgi:uncharacterized protein
MKPINTLLGGALALVLAAGSLAHAQGPVQTQAQDDGPIGSARPDPAGLSPPIVSDSSRNIRIDAGRLAMAQQIFDITGEPSLRVSTRSLTTTLSVQLSGALLGKDDLHAKAMVAAVTDGLNSITPQLRDEAVSHIAHDFTEDQLKEMLAFYSSPTGRLAAHRMPLITQQTVGSILTYLPAMMQGIQDSYCSRVKCTRAEKKAFSDVAARVTATRRPVE